MYAARRYAGGTERGARGRSYNLNRRNRLSDPSVQFDCAKTRERLYTRREHGHRLHTRLSAAIHHQQRRDGAKRGLVNPLQAVFAGGRGERAEPGVV